MNKKQGKKVPAMPARMKAETRSLFAMNNPTVIAIAKIPAHHKTGVPIAKISCEHDCAPQFLGVS